MEKSYCLKNGMYRVRRLNKGTVSFMKNIDLDLYNKQNTASNREPFEFYPYKPYWVYRLRFKYRKYINPIVKLNIHSKRHMTIVVFMILTFLGMFYIAYEQGVFNK